MEWEPDHEEKRPSKRGNSVKGSEESTPTWQAKLMKELLNECLMKMQEYGQHHPAEITVDKEYAKLSSTTISEYESSSKLRKQLRKFLKGKGFIVEEKANENVSKLQDGGADGALADSSSALLSACVNCGPQPLDGNNVFFDTSTNRLMILYPTAEIDNDFRCEIGHANNPGRISRTSMEIVGYGTYMVQNIWMIIVYVV
jgi:hypothetical protein